MVESETKVDVVAQPVAQLLAEQRVRNPDQRMGMKRALLLGFLAGVEQADTGRDPQLVSRLDLLRVLGVAQQTRHERVDSDVKEQGRCHRIPRNQFCTFSEIREA